MLALKKITKRKLITSVVIIILMLAASLFLVYKNFLINSNRAPVIDIAAETKKAYEAASPETAPADTAETKEEKPKVKKDDSGINLEFFKSAKFQKLEANANNKEFDKNLIGKRDPFIQVTK